MYDLRKAVYENQKERKSTNLKLINHSQALLPIELPSDLQIMVHCECADGECHEHITILLGRYLELVGASDLVQIVHYVLVKPKHMFPRYEEPLRGITKDSEDFWVLKGTV